MMTDQKPGISFRETMAGPFALGVTDPQAGAAAGRTADTTLTMTATVLIRDIDSFINDRDHAGELVGHITFPPLGDDIPARDGKFNLFSPAEDPAMKWMIYELGFEAGGQRYYLAGKKEVRDDPGFDVWADTTTLLTRLHKGGDASGPVVGAGILRLGAGELVKLVASMTSPGSAGVTDRAATVAKFGRLFLGQLWDRYAGSAAS